MRKSLFTSFFLIAAATLGLANNTPNITAPTLPSGLPTPNPIELIGELSPQCQAGLLSIIANPEFFQCVPVGSLLPLLTDPTFLPSILQDPLHNAAKLVPVEQAICAVPKCSDEGVANALKTIQESCSSDLKNPLIQLAIGVVTFYSPVRDIICFKDGDQFCVVETIGNLLHLPHSTVPLAKGFKLPGLGIPLDDIVFADPKTICTKCNKNIVNTLEIFFVAHPEAIAMLDAAVHIGEEELFIAHLYFAMKCGFQFEDHKISQKRSRLFYAIN